MVWLYELLIFIVLWAVGFSAILPTIPGCQSKETIVGPALHACLHPILLAMIVLPLGFIIGGVLYTTAFAAISGAHVEPSIIGSTFLVGFIVATVALLICNYVQTKFITANTATFDSENARRKCAVSMTVLDIILLGGLTAVQYWMNKP